jgi:hypothetical protein
VKLPAASPYLTIIKVTFMKYLNKMILFLTVLLFSGCSFVSSESGGYLDSNTKQIKADAAGRLEAAGGDLKVYEFTPQTNAKMQCVFVSGTSRKAGLFCFPKGDEK